MSAIVRERHILGSPPVLIILPDAGEVRVDDYYVCTVDELMEQWPSTVPERIVRVFCNVARQHKKPGQKVEIDRKDTSFLFSEDEHESFYLLKALKDRRYLEGELTRVGFSGWITPEGWEHFDQITRGGSSPENAVFVAMWFGGKQPEDRRRMSELYEQAIKPAVESAGYRVDRVDYTEHNEDIVDKILGMIRLAPFVIAEFTGQNRGVYYEAGFARGLGRTVIHCCPADQIKSSHFDTMQLNHVLWSTPEELKEKLRNRILGTIGPGPFGVTEST